MNCKVLLLVLLLAPACATVHHGSHQTVPITTDPPGAVVHVQCAKVKLVTTTPASVRLPRRAENCSVLLERSGFRSETVVFESTISPWTWGNFAAPAVGSVVATTRQSDQAFVDFLVGAVLGGAGFGIDAWTGAMWKLEPERIERTLEPSEPAPPAPTAPRVP